MNPLIRQMLGRQVQEDVPVPVAVRRSPLLRNRDRRGVQRRTAAAMMGVSEAETPIIPDDAEEMEMYGGSSGIQLDSPALDDENQPETPEAPDTAAEEDETGLIQPRAALVAPDVTPKTLEPIDPSEVPAPSKPATTASGAPKVSDDGKGASDALNVLLGRTPGWSQLPPENIVTAEASQASVNASLGLKQDFLGQGKEMPPPVPGNPSKVMEAFYRFGVR